MVAKVPTSNDVPIVATVPTSRVVAVFAVINAAVHLLVLIPNEAELTLGTILDTLPLTVTVSPTASPNVVVPPTTRLPSTFAFVSTSILPVTFTDPKLPAAVVLISLAANIPPVVFIDAAVALASVVLFTINLLSNVDMPVTPNVLDNVVAPVTPSVLPNAAAPVTLCAPEV